MAEQVELQAVEEAMDEAVYLAEQKLKQALGDGIAVVGNVATPTHAFGSYIPHGAPSMLADSLRQSADEVEGSKR